MSIKTIVYLVSGIVPFVSIPILTSNFFINFEDLATPGDSNSSYKKITIWLFDKDGNEKDPRRLGNSEKYESEEYDEQEDSDDEDCDESLCNDTENPYFFRVIWERPSNIDWYGIGKIERWYKVQPLSAFTTSYSRLWQEFQENDKKDSNSSAAHFIGNDIPEQFKKKKLENNYPLTAFINS